MLPECNAVADIVCKLDEATGAVAWRISSFDPATMNVTEDKEFAINAEQFFLDVILQPEEMLFCMAWRKICEGHGK